MSTYKMYNCCLAIIKGMAATNRKISTIILLKNDLLVLFLFLFTLFNASLFCLYCCIKSFNVSGAFNNLESISNVCNEIGITCSYVVQF